MHTYVWDKTSNFFHFFWGGGRGSDIKQHAFPFILYVALWMVSKKVLNFGAHNNMVARHKPLSSDSTCCCTHL